MLRVRAQLGLTDSFYQSLPERTIQNKIGIAVLDSGMALHPDLKEHIAAFRDFTGREAGKPSMNSLTKSFDDYGHGTHVCGILCGDGRLSEGLYRGIVPNAKLIVGKVLDHRGDGMSQTMIEGMEWVLGQKNRYGIRLLNVSVGISQLRERRKLEALQEMIRRLTKAGILVVCAAGNHGPAAGTLSALGEIPEVISVGCHDGIYYRTDPRRCDRFCGRGKERAIPRKPDVVAPGTCIISCSANNGKRRGMPEGYEERSGTSMSTAIVTGCLALALRVNPMLDISTLKHILTSTCRDLGEPWNKQGWGMLQPRKMIQQVIELQKKDKMT